MTKPGHLKSNTILTSGGGGRGGFFMVLVFFGWGRGTLRIKFAEIGKENPTQRQTVKFKGICYTYLL